MFGWAPGRQMRKLLAEQDMNLLQARVESRVEMHGYQRYSLWVPQYPEKGHGRYDSSTQRKGMGGLTR